MTCWGSRGRRFKSCQPDGEVAGRRPFPPLGGTAFSLTVCDVVAVWSHVGVDRVGHEAESPCELGIFALGGLGEVVVAII
jgi:hypothetical protein